MLSIACSSRRGLPSSRSNRVGRSASLSSTSMSAPMPINRNGTWPLASPASSGEATRNKISASCVGSARRRERVRSRKSAVLSFSVTAPAASDVSFKWAETRSQSGQRVFARATASASSCGNVVSAEIDFAEASARTARLSIPLASRARCSPNRPYRAANSCSASAANWPISIIPSAASRRCSAAPTPHSSETGLSARNAGASPRLNTAKPRGLSRSDAIFARNLLSLSPIERLMPSVASTRRARLASVCAGAAP